KIHLSGPGPIPANGPVNFTFFIKAEHQRREATDYWDGCETERRACVSFVLHTSYFILTFWMPIHDHRQPGRKLGCSACISHRSIGEYERQAGANGDGRWVSAHGRRYLERRG